MRRPMTPGSVEHFECPSGIDYLEAFNALMDYLEALMEEGLPDPEEEWERRYMDEVKVKEKRRVALPV